MKKQEIYDYIKSHKVLTTEDDDSPFDSSSFDAKVASGGTGDMSNSTNDLDSSSSTSTSNTSDTTIDSPFDSGDFGSEGGMSHSAPTFNNDIDLGDEEDKDSDQPKMLNNLPKGKVLNLIFNDDKPEEVKVKVLNTDTGEVEIKDISEISI